jgi:hypothetical protein
MGTIYGSRFSRAHYVVSPSRLAVSLAALSLQCTRMDVRYRLAFLPGQPGFPLYKLRLRDYGPGRRLSLYSYCLYTGYLHRPIWPTRQLSKKQTALITVAVSVVFLGGAVLGSGPPWELLPGPYLVTADARSIEPEGIQAAFWAGSYLGPDNRIGTDRINALLMNAFGNQFIVNSLADNINVTPVFFSPSLGPDEVATLQHAGVQYLVVDLRLSTALPALGFYYEPDEPDAFQHTHPISLQALTKFNTVPQIDRVFDSGDLVIYDVGGLTNAP